MNPHRQNRWWIPAVALVATTAVLGSACGSDDPADGSAEGSTASDAGEESGEVVRLLTYDSFALADEVAAAFTEQTGATIEVVQAGDSGAMLAGALLTAGAPEADVIFGIDNTTAGEANEAGFLVEYRPPGAENLDPALSAPDEVAGHLTPIDTSEVCVNMDRSWYEAEGIAPPESFEDLAAPRYAGQLVVENPVNSSPGMAFMLGSIDVFGEDGWLQYWEDLRENDVRVAQSWDDAYYNDYSVSGGDRPLVVSYASSPPAEVVFGEGEVEVPSSEVLDSTCVTQVEYAGVLEGSDQPELAKELIGFMLEDQWQSALPLSNFVYPVTDVELPEEFLRWAPRPTSAVKVDPEDIADRRDDWLEQWRSTME